MVSVAVMNVFIRISLEVCDRPLHLRHTATHWPKSAPLNINSLFSTFARCLVFRPCSSSEQQRCWNRLGLESSRSRMERGGGGTLVSRIQGAVSLPLLTRHERTGRIGRINDCLLQRRVHSWGFECWRCSRCWCRFTPPPAHATPILRTVPVVGGTRC